MDEEKIASRLKNFINYLGISDSVFADECKLSRSTLSLFLSGKNKKINDVILKQIHQAFPSLSINWLLFDEGEMIFSNNPVSLINKEDGSCDIPFSDKTNENENTNFIRENQEFTGNDTDLFENSKEIKEKNLINLIKDAVNDAVKSIMDTSFCEDKINSIIKSEKKIKNITVYYTDNTFEILKPSE